MGFRKPIPGPARDTLQELRLKLERLERTGDLTSPSIADLKRIVLARIAELEAASPNKEPAVQSNEINAKAKNLDLLSRQNNDLPLNQVPDAAGSSFGEAQLARRASVGTDPHGV
jgi:hypothetical protein